MKYDQKVLADRRMLAVRFGMDDKDASAELDVGAVDALAREIALQAALVGDGQVTFQMGRDFVTLDRGPAADVVRFLHSGKLALEELIHAERIVMDSAILMRSGAPFSLSDHPVLKDEARKEAAWNSDLRRHMPGGVKSGEVFGLPKIIMENPQ